MIFFTIIVLWNFFYVNNALSIYSHVGDDVQLSWELNPIPNVDAIITVKNPSDLHMFYVLRTNVSGIHTSYTQRIVNNGSTAIGLMSFTLKHITTLDAGEYTASVAGAAGSAVYQGPTLYVLGKPTKPFVTELSPAVVTKHLQLSCFTSSTTVPGNHNLSMTYTWNVDGVNITNSNRRYLFNSSRISIQNININDKNKTVICTGTEHEGITSDKSNIYVIDPLYGPGEVKFTPSTTNYSPTEGRILPDITCTADCNPNCNYSWSKDGQVLSLDRILSLRNINRNDTGVYSCTAWNGHGTTDSSGLNVNVKYPSRITGISSSEINVQEGQNITLKCPIDAVPLPIAVWSKDNGTTFLPSSKYSNPSLFQIESTNCVDTGYYRCTVNNNIGDNSLDYRTYRLNVECAPRLKFLQINPYPVPVAKDEGFNLTTSFIAFPLPNITWIFKDMSIKDTGHIAVIRSKDFEISTHLSKDSVSEYDFGVYTVVAENELGNIYASYNVHAQVRVIQRPPVAVIGGVTGSVFVLIVIGIIVFVVLFARRGKKNTKENININRLELTRNNSEGQMNGNQATEPMFIKPERLRSEIDCASGKIFSNDNTSDESSEVPKSQSMDKNTNIDDNVTYALVQKPRKGDKDIVSEASNTDLDTGKDLKRKPSKAKKAKRMRKSNEDGLQYIDIVLAPIGSGKAVVIHGLKDKTSYVDIDFSKTGNPSQSENKETSDK